MRGAPLGMGGLLVGEGGADGEAGGDSACSSAELQLVGVLSRGKCSGVAAATGREGRTGGARGRRSELGRVRFDPGQPRVQRLPGAADANPWCQTLPSGTGFEATQVSLVSCAPHSDDLGTLRRLSWCAAIRPLLRFDARY